MSVKDDAQYPVLTVLINQVQEIKDEGMSILGDEETRKANEIVREENEAARQQRIAELENVDAVQFDGRLSSAESQLNDKAKHVATIEDYGAKANDDTFDNLSIINQAIIDLYNTDGGILEIPDRTYYIKPTISKYINLKSGVSIRGRGAKSVIKVMPTTGNYALCIGELSASVRIKDVRLSDFTIDHNGDANTNCDIGGVAIDKRQHSIQVSNYENVHVDNILIYGTGMNQIKLIGNSVDSNNGSVTNCTIYFKRGMATTTPTYDNTGIFVSGRNYKIVGNKVISLVPAQGLGGIEVHGAYSVITDNFVKDYINAMHVQADHPTYGVNSVVANNILANCITGIMLWDSQDGVGLDTLTIQGNTITPSTLTGFTPDSVTTRYAGIVVTGSSVYHPYKNINITNNLIKFDENQNNVANVNTAYSGGIILGTSTLSQQDMINIKITGNIILNSPCRGINVAHNSSTTPLVKNVKISDNLIIDGAQNTTTSAGDRLAGIVLRGKVVNVSLENNVIRDTSPTPKMLNAIYANTLDSTSSPILLVNNTYTDINGNKLPITMNGNFARYAPLLLKSPNNTVYVISVSDAGTLTASAY